MFYRIAKFLCWLPLTIIHPTKIIGKKNRIKGKAILCCNHRSNWDVVLYLLHTHKKVKILAKKELFKNKLLGAILRNFGGIEIDRAGNDMNAIKACMKALKNEEQLFIFPEGTRIRDEEQVMGQVKSGLALIAIKTKTPIVPIWIERKPRIFRKSVYRVGKPFELSQFYGQKLDEATLHEASEIVREKMLELHEESLQNNKKNGKSD